MADKQSVDGNQSMFSPKIVYIRLEKNLTKERIQKEIVKSVKNAFKDTVHGERRSSRDKSCENFPVIKSDEVCEVAIGPEFIGIVLNNGRVYRIKCSSNTLELSKKPKKSTSEKSSDIFQVQSDEAYARRLQDQLNNRDGSRTRSLPSTLNINSPPVSVNTEELIAGSADSLFPEMKFLSVDGNQTSSLSLAEGLNVIEENAEEVDSDKKVMSDCLDSERTILPAGVSVNSQTEQCHDNKDQNSQRETSSKNSNTGAHSTTESSKSNQVDKTKGSTGVSENSQFKTGNSDSNEVRTSIATSSNYSSSLQAPQSSLATPESRNMTQTRSDISVYPQHSVSSSTFIHRTIFPADPFYYRPPRGLCHGPLILPRPSRALYNFDSRRLRETFGTRSGMRYHPQGRTVHYLGPHMRNAGSVAESSKRSKGQSGNNRKRLGIDNDNAEFFYPKLGELELLETESGEDVFFEHIAALHSEFLLVEKHSGTLYHWPYVSLNTRGDQTVMEDAMDTDDEGIQAELMSSVPRAKPHPLLEELGLVDEHIRILAARNIRCSLVTRSGKICTFYDNVIREPDDTQTQVPALIQELSHPARVFSEVKNEVITAIDCSDFLSSIMTQSGKVFWWGLLPSEERQGLKQKLHKVNSDLCNISVGDSVQLRRHLPGFPGALVYSLCDTRGPRIARLISHETSDDGSSTAIVKIKVEVIKRLHTTSDSCSRGASPVTIPKVDSPLSAVRGGSRQLEPLLARRLETVSTGEGTGSGSNISAKAADATEIWDVSNVVFLESESKMLGKVVAIDGPHVIVRVSTVSSQNESSLRVFKVSELETIMVELGNAQGTSSSVGGQVASSLIYRGCIQHQPKCIVNAQTLAPPPKVKEEVLTGLKPVAMATTEAGVNILVQRNSDGKSFYLGSATDVDNDNSRVFTSVMDDAGVVADSDSSVTVEAESVIGDHAALSPLTQTSSSELTGQKRKRTLEDDDLPKSGSSVMGLGCRSQLPKSCQVGPSCYPSLHSLPVNNLVLMCDRYGCLYERPYNTKLSNPSYHELVPLKCLSTSLRMGHMVSSENSEQKVLVIVVAFQHQKLIPAIQSGTVSKVQDVVDSLESMLQNSGTRGKKGRGEVKGAKRIAVEHPGEPASTPVNKPGAIPLDSTAVELSSEVAAVINEHVSCNQNVLHVCCTNPSFLLDTKHIEGQVEMEDYNQASDNIETAVLDLLLNHKVFGPHFVPMLKAFDARGCTPFMTAIQCHNLKAATFILDFVEKNKGKGCSVQDMIFPSSSTGITPLHALAVCTFDNLSPAGLGSSLTVSNLPSSYTPRILLRLFQSRYPSAYRATIPVMNEGEMFLHVKSSRQRYLEFVNQKNKGKDVKNPKLGSADGSSLLNPSATAAPPPTEPRAPLRRRRFQDTESNRIPVIGSRRETQEGMVTFANPKELRRALIEMDKHVVSSEMTVPEGGLANLVQYVLHVKLTEAQSENERSEMEVGMQGVVYGVSSGGGTTKISRKTQTNDLAYEKEHGEEDELACNLFSHLLLYTELSTSTNRENETVLAFLINNNRWIKPTSEQSRRLSKYNNSILGSSAKPESKEDVNKSDEVTAEIKITASSGSSSIEGNLLAQLDDISNSFKSLVDTLSALEREGMQLEQPQTRPEIKQNATKSDGQNTSLPESGDLMSFPSTVNQSSLPKDTGSLPILVQLTKSWPCIVATVLGGWPFKCSSNSESEMMSNEDQLNGLSSPSETCSLDTVVHSLLTHPDESLLLSFVETIITEMNNYASELPLDTILNSRTVTTPFTRSNVAYLVGMRFLRSVVRQMSVHLSKSSLSYIDLRTRVGGSTGVSSLRSAQSDNVEFKRKTRKVLCSFSWLAVHEFVQAAEATILPVRVGVVKPQLRSTGSSVTNSLPLPRFPNVRVRPPGIRVSGPPDAGLQAQGLNLRTAAKISKNKEVVPLPRCRGIRLANFDDASATPSKRKPAIVPEHCHPSSLRRSAARRYPMVESDSDSDDEENSAIIRSSGVGSDIDIDDPEDQTVVMATGITYEHPFAWALDGRLSGENGNSAGPQHLNLGAYATTMSSPPSVHTGNCYLTRMFARLVKEAVDMMMLLSDKEKNSREEPSLPVLSLTPTQIESVQEIVTSLLDESWVWLARILDVVEGQLQMGKQFDTKRYLATLQQSEEPDFIFSRHATAAPRATPEEYLMFLLRSHNSENSDSLPVMDMLCYEHVVYVLDSLVYSLTHWPRSQAEGCFSRSLSTQSTDQAEDLTSSSTERSPSTDDITNVVRMRRRTDKNREQVTRFFGMDVLDKEHDQFLTKLSETLQHKSQLFVPRATWEIFTQGKYQSIKNTNESVTSDDDQLPVTQAESMRQSYCRPLVTNWTPEVVVERWKISVDLFSRLFLSDGPGAERDSFLAARAGVAGRLARFRRTITYLRESVTSETQQGGFGIGGLGLGARVGTTLSLSVKRIRLIEDTLRILGDMTSFHYSNFRAKFEGEEGSGPGVNRGFFAAVANALKTEEKFPPETTSLLHEPGKLPEQSGFYSPKPFSYPDATREDSVTKNLRHKMFTAVGRFIGFSLWFNNTVPINFSRHVVKYLLDQEITWEDLAYFNADLFEGLGRMMLEAAEPAMTSEQFQSTYCCHFETSVGGTVEELVPGGSLIPVTPENIYKYVKLYANKVMIGSVESELRAMRQGLLDVIPSEVLLHLKAEDFQLLLSGGTTDIDINRLKSVINFTNSNGCSVDILERFKQWFWSIVQKMTPLHRQQLLYFCTGSAMLPAFPERRDGDQEDLVITIDVISGNTRALPMATTCGQRMSIPLYPSRKILKRKLLQAIQCQSYGLG